MTGHALQKYKTIRHYHQPGDCHELTFSCYKRWPILTNDTWRQLLAESIDKSLQEHEMNLSAFVFMPEHMHLLVWPQDPMRAEISSFLKTLKQSCSTKIKHQLAKTNSDLFARLTVTERPGKTVFRFWQEGPGYDRNLQSARSVLNSVDYIHNNPVRRGLAIRAIDWPWSSARHYIADAAMPPITVPRWTALPPEFLDNAS